MNEKWSKIKLKCNSFMWRKFSVYITIIVARTLKYNYWPPRFFLTNLTSYFTRQICLNLHMKMNKKTNICILSKYIGLSRVTTICRRIIVILKVEFNSLNSLTTSTELISQRESIYFSKSMSYDFEAFRS